MHDDVGLSALVRSTIAWMRSSDIQGSQAWRSAMAAIRSLSPAGHCGGERS
jgi:hypothetical protein